MRIAKDILYATVGAGDVLFEKAHRARSLDLGRPEEIYQDFVARGRRLTRTIGNATPTKRAVEQSKTARSQVRGAATSVSKAVRANATATATAARKAARS